MLNTIVLGLSKIANGTAIAANTIGTLVVLALVAVVNFDVVARGVFNAPFPGAYEVVQFSIVFIVFLQLPDVVRVDRLTRSDGFLTVLHTRKPRTTAMIRRVINTMSAIFMLMIAIIMFPEFIEMLHSKDYFGVPGIFTIVWWPVKLVIACSAALCTVIFALKVLTAQDKPQLIRAPEHNLTSIQTRPPHEPD
jgi:TRAP-type C4-dicarboxylate transport system permease small subunit